MRRCFRGCRATRGAPEVSFYNFQSTDAAAANVEGNRPAVEAGLAAPEAGGDFTDGVIAYEGAWLGGETFVLALSPLTVGGGLL